MGESSTDLHSLDLGTSWRWVAGFTPRPLYHQGKSPQYPLGRRLGEPRAGLDDVEKFLITPALELRTPVVQPVPTALFRLFRVMQRMCEQDAVAQFEVQLCTFWRGRREPMKTEQPDTGQVCLPGSNHIQVGVLPPRPRCSDLSYSKVDLTVLGCEGLCWTRMA